LQHSDIRSVDWLDHFAIEMELEGLHELSQSIAIGEHDCLVSSTIFHGQWRLQVVQEQDANSERWFGCLLISEQLLRTVKSCWPDRAKKPNLLATAIDHIAVALRDGFLEFQSSRTRATVRPVLVLLFASLELAAGFQCSQRRWPEGASH
jgi:hypothetical protein